MGNVFGDTIAALTDQILGWTAATVLTDEEVFSTPELRTAFFRPIQAGCESIEGTVIHRGRGTAYCEATFTSDDGVPY